MTYEGRHVNGQSRRRWLWALGLLVGLAMLSAGTGVGTLWSLSRDLPDVQSIQSYRPGQVTRVYADNNELIGQFYVEKRLIVPITRVPKVLVQAVVAVEDARFFTHRGIDPIGIGRAMLRNLGEFRIREGASTITQQLARALFLTPERSLTRKIKEVLLALRIEKLLSKEEILELYLNQIYFGQGVYGIQAAAHTYFGKDVDEIDLAEAAFIASLPKAPSDYSPYRHPERAKHRQGIVLRRMVSEGFVDEEQFRMAYQQDLYFERPTELAEIAPYFVEAIRQHLRDQYGQDAVYKGGLKVYTTLDVELQVAANTAVAQGLRALDKRQGFRGPIGHREIEPTLIGEPVEQESQEGPKVGSLRTAQVRPGDLLEVIVTRIDPYEVHVEIGGLTGTIGLKEMAWARHKIGEPEHKKVGEDDDFIASDILSVGDVITAGVLSIDKSGESATFSLEQEPLVEGALLAIDPQTGGIKAMVGGYDFQRSEFNRAIQAKRQPGSAFKPFIYLAALERGLPPSTILIDGPIIYKDPILEKVWKPVNYAEKFYGPIPMREALIHSRNLATIRLLEKVGIPRVISLAQRMGIHAPLTRDLSLALGSSGLSLLELTSAYGVLANEGMRVEPMMIRSVTDDQGQLLEFHEPNQEEVLRRETAYVMTNMLQDVIQRGTGRRAKVLKWPLAGKTGTTNDYTDAWFMGYTPNVAVGVWVGFDDRRTLGDREAGSRVALPIWIDFMREALPRLPQEMFEIPDEILLARVDPETGLLASSDTTGVVEFFLPGTEPVEESEPRLGVTDFYRLENQTPDEPVF